jgi:hypothetical protein
MVEQAETQLRVVVLIEGELMKELLLNYLTPYVR